MVTIPGDSFSKSNRYDFEVAGQGFVFEFYAFRRSSTFMVVADTQNNFIGKVSSKYGRDSPRVNYMFRVEIQDTRWRQSSDLLLVETGKTTDFELKNVPASF